MFPRLQLVVLSFLQARAGKPRAIYDAPDDLVSPFDALGIPMVATDLRRL